MKQITMKVEGYVTVEVDDFGVKPDDIPVKLDVFTKDDVENSRVVEVIETDITIKEIQTAVDI